jgi:hypothetical protein
MVAQTMENGIINGACPTAREMKACLKAEKYHI